VRWDDGDPSGRQVPYNRVALDEAPDADSIAVGTIVIFPQGRYRLGGTHGMRYHLGVVTAVAKLPTGEARYAGRHVAKFSDGKLPFREYRAEFADLALSDLRLSANALDVTTSVV
jgi:hypothetical protein